jgi:hypothetical protein
VPRSSLHGRKEIKEGCQTGEAWHPSFLKIQNHADCKSPEIKGNPVV